VAIAPSGAVWIGTDVGVAKFWHGTMATVHQASGLVSRTITRKGIVIDNHLGLWFATSNGVYTSSDPLFVSSEPPLSATPRLTAARLVEQGISKSIVGRFIEDSHAVADSSQTRRMVASSSFPAFSVLEFDVSSLIFPSSFVMFKTCVVAGKDTLQAYSNVSKESALRLTNLADGEYRLLVQARKEGSGEVWSAPLVLHFRIEPPFYASAVAYIVYAALTLVIGGLSIVTVRSARDKRALERSEENTRRLEELVAERTGELRQTNSNLELANNEISRQMEIQAEQAREIELANTMLQERYEELREINQEKNELMGIVAHDLKNPIGAVRSYAEMIENKTIKGDDVVIASGQIVHVSNRMLELVKNLLDMNQLESGGLQFNMVSFDISPVVESVVYQYHAPAEAKQIKLHYIQESPENIASADEQALMQVLDNLMSNAVKYSPYGKNVFVRVKRNDKAVRVEVRDEGEGISEEDMKKLFGKFARLSAQPTGGEHSTGLGLSIVKKMVEAMNGRVWCESEVGKGATFMVELPTEKEYLH
jgi:signal transduction histidine kinase